MTSGCEQCHSVGRPNSDGTIGNCTACHTRHTSSVAHRPSAHAPARQCHMGPDHSQIEIYEESKHGVMFQAQEQLLNLDAPPKNLTTRDMFVPTCATCHMSGINGLGVTHDPSERLSYYLANAITRQAPELRGRAGQDEAGVRAMPHRLADRPRLHSRPSRWSTSPTAKVQFRPGSRRRLAQGRISDRSSLLPIRSTSSTSICGTTMGAPASMARSWAAPISCSGTATTPCCRRPLNFNAMAAELRRQHGKAK